MYKVVEFENGYVKKVRAEFTPMEWLVVQKALIDFVSNTEIGTDKIIAEQMLFRENKIFSEERD